MFTNNVQPISSTFATALGVGEQLWRQLPYIPIIGTYNSICPWFIDKECEDADAPIV